MIHDGPQEEKGKKRKGVEPHKSGTVYPAREKEIQIQQVHDDHAGVYTERIVPPEPDHTQDNKQ